MEVLKVVCGLAQTQFLFQVHIPEQLDGVQRVVSEEHRVLRLQLLALGCGERHAGVDGRERRVQPRGTPNVSNRFADRFYFVFQLCEVLSKGVTAKARSTYVSGFFVTSML